MEDWWPSLDQSGGDLPCTTLHRCRLHQRTRAGFVVVAAEGGRVGGGMPAISFVCSCDSTSKRALERQEAMFGVVPTEGRGKRRMSVGLWLWLGAGAQVNIAGEWQ